VGLGSVGFCRHVAECAECAQISADMRNGIFCEESPPRAEPDVCVCVSLSDWSVERQVLHSQCKRLEAQNHTLTRTAEQMSVTMGVREGTCKTARRPPYSRRLTSSVNNILLPAYVGLKLLLIKC